MEAETAAYEDYQGHTVKLCQNTHCFSDFNSSITESYRITDNSLVKVLLILV